MPEIYIPSLLYTIRVSGNSLDDFMSLLAYISVPIIPSGDVESRVPQALKSYFGKTVYDYLKLRCLILERLFTSTSSLDVLFRKDCLRVPQALMSYLGKTVHEYFKLCCLIFERLFTCTSSLDVLFRKDCLRVPAACMSYF